MSLLSGNGYSSKRNALHITPNKTLKSEQPIKRALDLFNDTSLTEMESAQYPNYRVVYPEFADDREEYNQYTQSAKTTTANNLLSFSEHGDLNRQAREYNIIKPTDVLIDEFAKEINLDSKASKEAGWIQDGIDILQTPMYAISGGIVNWMKTGDLYDSFKQSMTEIRHTFDDDYVEDPNSWFSRGAYRAEWGQILRSNDAIIGRKLLDIMPFSATDSNYDEDGNWLGNIEELWNVVTDKEYRDAEVLRERRRLNVKNVTLTNAENNAIAMLGFGLDLALDPTTYLGYGIWKGAKFLRGTDTILKGTETAAEAAARATRSYNKGLRADPQSRVAIRRANLKEELQAKASDPSNTKFIDEDVEKGLREFDKAEADKIAAESAQRLTKLGRAGKALGGEVRPEGYGIADMGLGSVPLALNFATATFGNSKLGKLRTKVGATIGDRFIVNNAIKRLQNPRTARNVASFLKNNIDEIKAGQPDSEQGQKIIDHIEALDMDALSAEVSQEADTYLKFVKDSALESASETQRIKNGMLQLNKMYGLDARYAMTLFASKPAIAKQVIEAGDYTPEIKDELYQVLDVAKDLMQEIAEKDMRYGLLDETSLRAEYTSNRNPLSKAGERSMRTFLESQALGEQEVQIIMEKLNKEAGAQSVQAKLSGGASATFQEKATFDDVYGKLLATNPTEMDFLMLYGNRSFESLRLRNTQKFADHILNDTKLAIPVNADIVNASSSPLHKKFKDSGFDFYSPAGDWKGEGQAYYAMPKDMAKALRNSNTLMESAATGKDPSKFDQFMESWNVSTTLWRQWALGSLGYVSRNIQSNVFTNYVAGVTNPWRYIEASMLQWGGTENMPRGLRSYVEFKTGGSNYLENYKFELKDGRVLSLKDMRAEMDKHGLFAANFTSDEMVELAGIESATFGIYKKDRRLETNAILKGIRDRDVLPEWGSTEVRVDNAKKNIIQTFNDAKGEPISDEDAGALAELYDGMARGWAWNNNTDGKLGVTPQDWWNKLTIEGFADVNQAKSKIVEQSLYQKIPIFNTHEDVIPASNIFGSANIKGIWEPWWDETRETLPALRSVMGRLVQENASIKGKGNIWKRTNDGDLALTFGELKDKIGSVLTGKNSPLSKQQKVSMERRVGKEKKASAAFPSDVEGIGSNVFLNIDDWIDFNATHIPNVTITKDRFVEALNMGLFRMDAVTQKYGMTSDNIQRRIGEAGEVEDAAIMSSPDASGRSINPERIYREGVRAEWPFNDMTLPIVEKYKTGKIAKSVEIAGGDNQMLAGVLSLDDDIDFAYTSKGIFPDVNYRNGYITANSPIDAYDTIPKWDRAARQQEAADEMGRIAGPTSTETNLAKQWNAASTRKIHSMVHPLRTRPAHTGEVDRALIDAEDSRIAHCRLADFVDKKTGDKYLVLNELQSDFFNPSYNMQLRQRPSAIDWIKKHYQDYQDTVVQDVDLPVTFREYMGESPWKGGTYTINPNQLADEHLERQLDETSFPSIVRSIDDPDAHYVDVMQQYTSVDDSVIDEFNELIISAPTTGLTDAELEEWVLNAMPSRSLNKAEKTKVQESARKDLDFDPNTGYGVSVSAREGKKLQKEFMETKLPAAKNDWMTPALKLIIQDAARGRYKKLIWAGDFKQVSRMEGWPDNYSDKTLKNIANNYTDTKRKGSVGDRINKVLADINAEADGGGRLAVGTYKDVDHKTGTYNSLDISDDLAAKSLNGEMTLFQKDSTAETTKIKGMISFLDQGRKTINAFKGADVSTMVHELAHLARRGGMIEDGDMDVINNWVFGRDVKGGRIDKELNKFQKEVLGDTGEMGWSDDDRRAFVNEVMWSNPNPLDGEKLNAEEKFAVAVEKYIFEGGLKPTGLSNKHIDALGRLKEAMRIVYDGNELNKLIPDNLPDDVMQKINKVLGQRVEPEPEKGKLLKKVLEIGGEEEERVQSAKTQAGQLFFGLEGEKLLSGTGIKNALGNNGWLRFTRGAARITEQNARGALFIQSMLDGMTGAEAANNVKKYLFDYSELTEFEKKFMRNVIPFYTWLRKNIPLQMESILKNPTKYANVAKIYSEFGGMTESMVGDDTPTPDYFTEQLAIRYPQNIGNQPTYLMPDLPYMDIETGEGFLDMDKWIGMSHPFIRLGLETVSNRKTLTGAPIESDYKARKPIDLFGLDVTDVYTPKVEHALEGLFPAIGTVSSHNKKVSQGKTDLEIWLRMFGAPIRTVDVDKVMRNRVIAMRGQTAEFKSKYEQRIKQQIDKKRRLMGLD